MSGEIEIAETEPVRLTQMRHAVEAPEAVALDAPSALDAELSGKRVEDGVDVGRNVQSPPLDVVGGIHDDGQVIGSNGMLQSLDQFCAARPAGENNDHLRSPRITVIVGSSQPAD